MGPAVAPFESANSSGGILALGDGTQWPVLEMPPGASANAAAFSLRSRQANAAKSLTRRGLLACAVAISMPPVAIAMGASPHRHTRLSMPINQSNYAKNWCANVFLAHKRCHDFLIGRCALATTG